MILYYAMGGGLGHLTRSLAILHKLPQLTGHVRLMVSSQYAALIIPYAPCPVDIIAGERLTSKSTYLTFLDAYLTQHRIEMLVLDTFPFGIVGEWLHIGRTLPRLLIARYLKWKSYVKRIETRNGLIPRQTLALEPLTKDYWHTLKRSSQLTLLEAPITLQMGHSFDNRGVHAVLRGGHKKDCVIIHSGNETEREVLVNVAKQKFRGGDPIFWSPDCFFPEQGIYPAEHIIPYYSTVISAAGYNMTAIASQAPPERIHLLHPFQRRFDNQFLRFQRFKQGLWQQQNRSGAQQAAQWLWHAIKNIQ